jgi:hypothetical protein
LLEGIRGENFLLQYIFHPDRIYESVGIYEIVVAERDVVVVVYLLLFVIKGLF